MTRVLTHGYACVISSGTCSVTSTLASLTVNPLPTVSVNSATICAGGFGDADGDHRREQSELSVE